MRREPKRPRAVVDTNLIVSGTILKRGSPFALLEAWRQGFFVFLLGQAQRDEVVDVVHRPKIHQKYAFTTEEIATLIRLLDTGTQRVSPRRRLPLAVRDPKDEVILAIALGGKADYLVTGDDDLLVLRGDSRLGHLQIVTVTEFLEVLATRERGGDFHFRERPNGGA